MHSPRSEAGFTLVEAMLSLTILAVLALGLTSIALQTREASENAVLESTALTIASGYMEQMKTMEYATLRDASTSGATIPTVINQGVSDSLTNGQWQEKEVIINVNNTTGNIQTKSFEIRPILTDHFAATGRDMVSVRIDVRWQTVLSKRTHARSLRTFVSNVPTY